MTLMSKEHQFRYEDEAIVRSYRHELGYGPDCDDLVDLQSTDIDPIDEALVPTAEVAAVAAGPGEAGAVHLVIRAVGKRTVRRERDLDGPRRDTGECRAGRWPSGATRLSLVADEVAGVVREDRMTVLAALGREDDCYLSESG